MTYNISGASIEIYTRVNPKAGSLQLKYYFGSTASDSNTFSVSNSFKSLLSIRVEAYEGSEKKATL